MRKHIRIIGAAIAVLLLATLITWIIVGIKIGWGPFGFLQLEQNKRAILSKYDPEDRTGEIVFYGASNFRLWVEMEEDLAEYKVQNHGFGGSTDKDLIENADKLLYPYSPKIVVFQTGSNDYPGLSGTDQEIADACMAVKRQMFETLHAALPDAKFIVVSGILMPGRDQYTQIVKIVNDELAQLCEELDYLYFVDAEAMTYDGVSYAEELFIEDGIHLTHEARLRWYHDYIKPVLEEVIEGNQLDQVRKD